MVNNHEPSAHGNWELHRVCQNCDYSYRQPVRNSTDYFLFENVGYDFGWVDKNVSKTYGDVRENDKYFDAYDDDDDDDGNDDNDSGVDDDDDKPNIFHRMCCIL